MRLQFSLMITPLLFMADSHAGTTHNLDSVFRIAKVTGASAVCIAGDLTSGDNKDYKAFAGALPVKDEMPTFVTPGNHDLWSDDGWKAYFEPVWPFQLLFHCQNACRH